MTFRATSYASAWIRQRRCPTPRRAGRARSARRTVGLRPGGPSSGSRQDGHRRHRHGVLPDASPDTAVPGVLDAVHLDDEASTVPTAGRGSRSRRRARSACSVGSGRPRRDTRVRRRAPPSDRTPPTRSSSTPCTNARRRSRRIRRSSDRQLLRRCQALLHHHREQQRGLPVRVGAQIAARTAATSTGRAAPAGVADVVGVPSPRLPDVDPGTRRYTPGAPRTEPG